MTFQKAWRTFLIVLVLFGLPALSWLFLQKGLEQRLAIVQELDSIGVAPVCLPLAEDSLVAPTAWKASSWLVAFVDGTEDSKRTEDLLEQIYRDLSGKARINILLFEVVKRSGHLSESSLQKAKSWFEVPMERGAWRSLALQGFHWPEQETGEPHTSMVALVNEEGVILNFYDLKDEKQLKKLIVHTAFINQKE